MRASRLGFAALVGVLAHAAPDALRAQDLTGYAQGQYQVFEQNFLRTDGTIAKQRIERWVQTLELQHMALPRSDLRVLSSFRLTDLTYRGLPDQSRSPQGSVQVSHPWASLFAAYRPTSVTGGLGRAGVAGVTDSGRTRTVTARSQETMLTGQIAPPSWPRLDLAWTRRHRNRDELSADESGVTRLARMSWANENLNLYGSLGDQHAERAGAPIGSSQRTGAAGGALHLAPVAGSNLDLAYDLNDARVGDPLRNSGSSRGHSASLNAGLHPDARSSWTGGWLWRRTESRGPRRQITEDHEGSLQYTYDPPGPVRLFGAGGARTLRVAGDRVFAENLSAVASLDGRVRTGWTGTATLTHVTNWQPGRSSWSLQAARVSSQMKLTRRFEFATDAQASTSDDTTLRAVRATTEANARARLTPWQAFSAGWIARVSRSGAGVLQGGATTARSMGWDARWRPTPKIELNGTTASTSSPGGARNTSRSAGMRWAAHARLQVLADWSKSSDQRATGGGLSVSGREIASVHALALISRKLQLDATAGVADRGGPQENRQATVTLTWAFGR